MNFLAHIYLSGNNKKVTIGNFIADGIKGKKHQNFSKNIQIGILLHRAIDSYTDAHPVFRESTKVNHKIQCAWFKFGQHTNVVCNQKFCIQLRLNFFDAIVFPTIYLD